MKTRSEMRFYMLMCLLLVYFFFYYVMATGILPSVFGLHMIFLYGSVIILIQLTRIYLQIVGGKS